MKHNWAFQDTRVGLASLIPIAKYTCDDCNRIERIYLNATKALVEILTLDDCPGLVWNTNEDSDEIGNYDTTVRECVVLLRTKSGAEYDRGFDRVGIITDALANISDRLDKLEGG